MGDREERLPENFDVVVIGTGITESIVSAAASRNGHTVLHLDTRDYYGSAWATLSFDSWISASFTKTPEAVSSFPSENDNKLSWTDNFRDFQQVWYSNDEDLHAELKKNCRKFNIDLLPKVILAREEVIELLIKSNVSRYLEFLRVGKLYASLLLPLESVIESIPLSRSDIFTSKSVSLVEKRSLVKFIEAILKPTEAETSSGEGDTGSEQLTPEKEDQNSATFDELVQTYKLSTKVEHLIKAAVQTLEDGFLEDSKESNFNQMFVTRCKTFLQSIGRYGNQTPYLWTLYGISEICQAFCRLSAVYGGLFILKRYISSIEEVENGLKIVSEKDEFSAKNLILGQELMYVKHPDFKRTRKVSKVVGRGVLVTIGGNLKTEPSKPGAKGDGIFLYKIGELEIIELNHLSQAVPKDYRLLQISFAVKETENSSPTVSPKDRIESVLGPFVDFHSVPVEIEAETSAPCDTETHIEPEKDKDSSLKKPLVVYGSYFWVDLFEEDDDFYRIKKGTIDPSENMNGRIFSCSTGTTEIASHVQKAKEIYERMFPDEEFLPKAPDMEDSMEENGFCENEVEPAAVENQNQEVSPPEEPVPEPEVNQEPS